MIVVLRGFGGTVSWYARTLDGEPRRPDASPTVEVLASDGTVLVAALTAATRDSVATTLAVGCGAGVETLELASTTGIVRGRRYVLGAQYEEVEVLKVVSSTVVRLVSPTWYGHETGAAFEGHRISYALSASEAAEEDDHCRALFTWELATVDQPRGQVDFAIGVSLPTCPVSPVDLHRLDPNLQSKLTAGVDVNGIIATAFELVTEDMSASGSWSYDYIGSERLKRAVACRAIHLCAGYYGEGYAGERERWWKEYQRMLSVFRSISASDDDRDGKVSAAEVNRGVRTFQILRAR